MTPLPRAPSVAAAVVALVGALSLAIAFAPILPQAHDDPEAWWYVVIGLPTTFWSLGLVLLVTWLGRHAASEGVGGAGPIVAVVSLVGGAVLGVVNSGSCFVLAEWARGGVHDPIGSFLLACVFGSPMGVGLGIVFGIAFAVLLTSGIAAAVGRSRDWVERFGLVAGPWTTAIGLLGILMARAPETLALQTGLAAAGIAWLGWSAVRSAKRRWFLAAAHAGTHPRYRVVELATAPSSADELGALVPIDKGARRSWLAEFRPVAGGAFRASEELVPVCAVPRDAPATLRQLGVRALTSLGVAIMLTLLLAASLSAASARHPSARARPPSPYELSERRAPTKDSRRQSFGALERSRAMACAAAGTSCRSCHA